MSLQNIFDDESLNGKFEDFYGETNPVQRDMFREVYRLHEKETGKAPEAFYTSPGRIEIVGNHTDHNAGKVLCASISLDTLGAVSKRDDGIIVVKSKGYPPLKVSVDDVEFRMSEFGSSSALIRGIVDYYRRAGKEVGGFNAYTVSNVPKGSGVSSSSAFELLIAEILNVIYNDGKIDAVFKAKASQYAESVFFGKPCGLMDQSAIALGGVNMIDFRSFENPIIEGAEWKLDLDIYVIATGGDHCDLTDDYAAIPAEMKSVAEALGGKLLRDVQPEKFYAEKESLKGKVSERAILRAEHYYEENRRVEQAFEAVKNRDEKAFLDAVNESGLSSKYKLQNLHSPKSEGREIENALDKAGEIDGVVAKRVHGGGFAGTILLFVKKDSSKCVNEQLNAVFGKKNVFKLNVRPVGATKFLGE